MSRRFSVLAKQQHTRPVVRFPDALVFLDNIRENDLEECKSMLRRASNDIDINALNDAGLTPLHQAVLDGNLAAAKLLLDFGADVNRRDTDTWTPLHAACAEGHTDIVRYLLMKGADKDIKTCEGERPLDLVDTTDLQTIGAMLESASARAVRLRETEEGQGMEEEDEASASSSAAKRRATTCSKRHTGHAQSSIDEDED